MKSENSRQSVELSHILQQFSEQYRDQYNPCPQQQKAIRAITTCRTSEDQMEWISSRKNFFAPIKVVGLIFRGCLCSLLDKGI